MLKYCFGVRPRLFQEWLLPMVCTSTSNCNCKSIVLRNAQIHQCALQSVKCIVIRYSGRHSSSTRLQCIRQLHIAPPHMHLAPPGALALHPPLYLPCTAGCVCTSPFHLMINCSVPTECNAALMPPLKLHPLLQLLRASAPAQCKVHSHCLHSHCLHSHWLPTGIHCDQKHYYLTFWRQT